MKRDYPSPDPPDDIAGQLAALSAEKWALLNLRLKKTSGEQTIPRRTSGSSAPLSFAQQRLWFLDQLEPNSVLYNIPRALRLQGPLNIPALHQALNTLVARHETLRTTFAASDGRPMQVIAAHQSLELPLIDLLSWPDTERETEALRRVTAEAQQPFDLARGPLLRVTLLRLEKEDHILVLTMHHIISDGWSMGVFFRELGTLYTAYRSGQPLALPELPIQYADFAVWQRQWLQGEELATHLAYWKQQLAGASPVLTLLTDHPRPAVQDYHGAARSVELPLALTVALKELSRQEGVTLFMLLCAAFQILLSRHTGQEDIVVGVPIANRARPEIEGLISFFVNTLVLRTNLSGNPTFRELLQRVREVCLGAYTHQDLPFEKLVEELQPQRDLSRNPLFEVMLNFSDPLPAVNLPGLTCEVRELHQPTAKFPLTLYVTERGGTLELKLVYQRALFSAERMICFLQQFQYLLEQIVAAPEKLIRFYSLVTPDSRRLLPDPSIALPEPQYELVTTLFASWANRLPEQPALRHGNRILTYRELADRANTLARTLLARGLERGDVVTVCGQRGFGLIASMLAVFLSGGVLLPIDRSLPPNRKWLLLREARAKHLLLVGDVQLEEQWSQILSSLTVTLIDHYEGRSLETDSIPSLETIPLPVLDPDDAAYIFFTSGTTGVPKGVLGCHKGLAHFLTWQRETFAVGPQDRCAQLTNLSFDPVLRDVFLPLTSGAVLCLPEDTDEFGADRILPWLAREQVSLLHTVPTVAQFWLDTLRERVSLPALRWVFFAGEPLTGIFVRRWREAFPRAGGVINLYGPTETTLVKCFYQVPLEASPGVQPAGWPLRETQAFVFGDNNQLCGVGEIGEIVLRTPFRTLGYLNAPEETQKRFVRNPFRDDERDVLYYTGDRGCYRPDGALEVLGRLDQQIKIHGVRIEPDEVAATLACHPMVRSCVVLGCKDRQEQNFLAAYVVPAHPNKTTISELQAYLSKELPVVMVPSAFIFLDTLPLTPNGKVDRRALPVPDQSRLELAERFVAPRTPIEKTLVRIWAEVLGVEQVSIHDNFFALGGHSLLAIQVMSRIRSALQVELPLSSLFETPTVAGLAVRIAETQVRGVAQEKVDRLLTELEALSVEDARQLLTHKSLENRGKEDRE